MKLLKRSVAALALALLSVHGPAMGQTNTDEDWPIGNDDWRVVSLNGVPTARGVQPYVLTFSQDGLVSGWGIQHCERLLGKYQGLNGPFSFSALPVSRPCPASEVAHPRDVAITRALEKATRAVMTPTRLQLVAKDGSSLILVRTDPALNEALDGQWSLKSLNGSADVVAAQPYLLRFNGGVVHGSGFRQCEKLAGKYEGAFSSFVYKTRPVYRPCFAWVVEHPRDVAIGRVLAKVSRVAAKADQLELLAKDGGSLILERYKPPNEAFPPPTKELKSIVLGGWVSETVDHVPYSQAGMVFTRENDVGWIYRCTEAEGKFGGTPDDLKLGHVKLNKNVLGCPVTGPLVVFGPQVRTIDSTHIESRFYWSRHRHAAALVASSARKRERERQLRAEAV